MNQTAPYEYFKFITNFSNPSPADVSIINDLSREYGLSNGVINVIIEYTLHACNQDLPRSYCEKLASKLQRLKVKDAMEAINALLGKTKKKRGKKESILNYNDINEEENYDNIDLEKLLEWL